MRIDPVDLLGPPVIALVFLLLSWSAGRSIRRGQPLTSGMRKVLFYGFLFVLGTLYSIAFDAMLGSKRPLWIALTAAWALLLAIVAWRRSKKPDEALKHPHEPISRQVAEGLPVVAMLVCLIGAAIDWEMIYEGQGRWPFGVLWIAGVFATIWLAGRHRRTTVIVSLRAFVVLLAIGAIARHSLPASIVAIAVACALFSLQKFWPSNPNGRDQVLGNSAGRG